MSFKFQTFLLEVEKEKKNIEKENFVDNEKITKLKEIFEFNLDKSKPRTYGLSSFSLNIVNQMIVSIINMIDQWSCFPGSFVNILSEHLFYIFRHTNSRELGLYVMALFIGRPKLIKFANSNKEGFKKNIKPLFFD